MFRRRRSSITLLYHTGLVLFLLLAVVESAPVFFKPPPSCTSGVPIDRIDHCCACDGQSDGVTSKRHDISPVTIPLPLSSENLGTALRISNGTLRSGEGRALRVIADNFPDTEDDQQIDDNTLVHIMELTERSGGDEIQVSHYTIGSDFVSGGGGSKEPQPSKGHTLAASENLILIGSPSTYPATAALYVKTSNPPWSLSVFLKEQTEDSEFGYAVALDEQTQFMAVSDPSNDVVYAYLTYADMLVDTVRPPTESSSNRRFGHQVLVQNDTMVVSSLLENAVYIFDRSGSKWSHAHTLHGGSDEERLFGWRIALDRDYLVVGSKSLSEVEVYRRTRYSAPSQWEHTQTLTAPGMTLVSRLGWGLDVRYYSEGDDEIQGVRIAVGDPMFLASVSAHGKVFLYELDRDTGQFVHCQAFTDEKTSFHTQFGTTVALSRDGMLAVGAPDTDSSDNGNGRLYLFDLRRHKQCAGCDGVVNSGATIDECGECGAEVPNESCAGCDGVPYSGKESDECGVCEGDNTACLLVPSLEGRTGLSTYTREGRQQQQQQGDLSSNAATSSTITTSIVYELEDVCNRIYTRLAFAHLPRPNPVRWSVLSEPEHGTLGMQSPTSSEFTLRTELELSQIIHSRVTDHFTLRVQDELRHAVEVHVSYQIKACEGCDGVMDSGKVEDDCGVCGGDGSTCHDCAGVVGGESSVDYCGECTLPAQANRTCLEIDDIEDQVIQCHGTMELSQAPQWRPVYEGQNVRWHIVKMPEHGAASIGYRTGLVQYHHRGKVNSQETVTFAGSDVYENEAQATVVFHVTGCDVVGCDGVMGSGKTPDRCGVCGGSDACVDCNDEPHGKAVVDQCGVCGGDGSSCRGEEGFVEGDVVPVEEPGNVAATFAGVPVSLFIVSALAITVVGVGFVWVLWASRRDRREWNARGQQRQWTDRQSWNYNLYDDGARQPL